MVISVRCCQTFSNSLHAPPGPLLQYKDGYKALCFWQIRPRPHLPLAYNQAPIQRTGQSEATLQDALSDTGWDMFMDSVMGSIEKLVDNIVPKATIRTFLNQKPQCSRTHHRACDWKHGYYKAGSYNICRELSLWQMFSEPTLTSRQHCSLQSSASSSPLGDLVLWKAC